MVNWNIFEGLPGAQDYNFEILSRSLVWLAYSRYGSFKAQLNQAGVEFDLKLDKDCKLGNNGQHFGWQCRWYGLPSGKNIGSTRSKKIKEALDKTIQTIPGITDWVLWTRHTLTSKDQNWFYSLEQNLSKKVKLHLWSSTESDTLLNTEALQLKETYFGDLIIRPENLSFLHKQAVAPIKQRWFPEVHQKVDAERTISRMLGRGNAWIELKEKSFEIVKIRDEFKFRIGTIPQHLMELSLEFLNCLDLFSDLLNSTLKAISDGEFKNLKHLISNDLKIKLDNVSSLPRKLRGARLQIGIIATNALADLMEADRLLDEILEFLNTRFVGIVADAGGGKTQLSATITSPFEIFPAGILLLGRSLKHNNTLDDLAKTVVVNCKPVSTMQGLIAGLNAAAERAKCILPLVIDGLNEAEDPREWKILLSTIKVTLEQYPNVLFICTLRSGASKSERENHYMYNDEDEDSYPFVKQCLPDNTTILEIPDFGDDIGDAIEKYFDFFKIKAQPNIALRRFLSHPLTLRIFCEVSNPTRKDPVGMEAIPRTLATLFEKYVELAACRIEELSPFHCRYHQADIIGYLDKLGKALWDNNARSINQFEFRKEINDSNNWNNSAINFMEQEGLILRITHSNSSEDEIIPIYDLLGGYLIAKHLIFLNGRNTIESWLKSKSVKSALGKDYSARHPLRDDIIRFLVALLPQYHNVHLWEVAPASLREEALSFSVLLEPKYLDRNTTQAVAENIKRLKPNTNLYLNRLYSIRDTEKHPLNVHFVDKILRELKVGKRDLVWSEWIRNNQDHLEIDLDKSTTRWIKNIELRTSDDVLLARWIMWMLTTTSHKLRHKASMALYWFGRGCYYDLFNLTIESLSINDPYVSERMLAVSYGVAMALAFEKDNSKFLNLEFPSFARSIFENLFGKASKSSTTHILILDSGRGIVELAARHNANLFSKQELATIYLSSKINKVKTNKKNLIEPELGESPFRMDFETYVIRRLIPNRSNHDLYKIIRSDLLKRIFDLGWNFKDFELVENSIERSKRSLSRHDDEDINKIDRYGKKYSWISYFEQKGLIGDIDKNDGIGDLREMNSDLDPTFPTPLNPNRIIEIDLLGNPEIPLKEWIRIGDVPNLSIFLKQDILDEQEGPWILLDGYIAQKDEKRGRSIFGFIRAFFIDKDQEDEFVSLLEKQRLGGRWLPEKYEESNCYAGEIPWSPLFEDYSVCELPFVVGENEVEEEDEEESYYIDGKEVKLSFIDEFKISGITFSTTENVKGDCLSDEEFKRLEIRKKKVLISRVKKKIKKLSALMPVCDLRTPGKTLYNEFTGGITLSKRFSEMLNLTTIPQSRDLKNSFEEKVTFQNSFQKGSFKDSERLFFLRKDQLDILLNSLNMSLVWAIWGERELSPAQYELWHLDKLENENPYSDFKQIFTYNKS